MKSFGKFLILAVVGFGLGAALAWFQASQQQQPAAVPVPAESMVSEASTLDAGPIIPGAPEMPAIDGESASSEDHAGHGMAEPADAAPVAGSSVGGAFALTDHYRNPVTEKSWPGKYTLVFFGFTNCPDICPAAREKITAAMRQLGPALALRVQPLLITTDPARDTPDVLKAYLADNADCGEHDCSWRFLGLTGTEEQVKAAQDAYKVYAAKREGGDDHHYMMDHSAYTYLMSPDGALLEIFGKDATAEEMATKIAERVSP